MNHEQLLTVSCLYPSVTAGARRARIEGIKDRSELYKIRTSDLEHGGHLI